MTDYRSELATVMPTAITGSVVRTEGTVVAVAGFPAPVGAIARIERQSAAAIEGEVIGFREGLTLVSPLGQLAGVRHGNQVRLQQTRRVLHVGGQLLGRVIDANGRVTDGLPQPVLAERAAIDLAPLAAVERPPIDSPLGTGIRAIDGMLTCGRGQRLGIFAGSGVGKSVTLGMMARNTAADINVIGLIGERGREVNEFIQRDLGAEGLARSVVVVATSDEPALLRVQAARTATAIAEHFRDCGRDVLLLMDSLTRCAIAQRELGLAAGEPPTTRGFPPSVFSMLPKIVERAGRTTRGSITAFYSVLVEGDDTNEPISDTVRGLLDGHIVLSRKLASQGHYPAIDVLESISRLATVVTTDEQRAASRTIRRLLAAYREHEDLISIGAYRSGANPDVDAAIAMRPALEQYLQQDVNESASFAEHSAALIQLASRCSSQLSRPSVNQTNAPPTTANPAVAGQATANASPVDSS